VHGPNKTAWTSSGPVSLLTVVLAEHLTHIPDCYIQRHFPAPQCQALVHVEGLNPAWVSTSAHSFAQVNSCPFKHCRISAVWASHQAAAGCLLLVCTAPCLKGLFIPARNAICPKQVDEILTSGRRGRVQPLPGGSKCCVSSAWYGNVLKYCLFVRLPSSVRSSMFKKCGIRDKRYFQKASAVNTNVHVHVTAYNSYTQKN